MLQTINTSDTFSSSPVLLHYKVISILHVFVLTQGNTQVIIQNCDRDVKCFNTVEKCN